MIGVIFLDKNVALVKNEKLSTKEEIILYFLIYSFIGWCLETIYAYIVFKHFVKRGFLYGPICPIYGFGAILLIFNLRNIKDGNNIAKFLISMISFSMFEYVASFLLEILFHQRWWDYTNEFMNFQGRICLTFSLLWGIIGILFINIIHPWVKNNINRLTIHISIKIKKALIYFTVIIFIIDEFFSILKYI